MAPERFVGIDVPKAWLDVAGCPVTDLHRVANDPDGIAALVAELKGQAPALVLLEPGDSRSRWSPRSMWPGSQWPWSTRGRCAISHERRDRWLSEERIDAALLTRFAEAIRPTAQSAVPDDVRHPDARFTRAISGSGCG